MFVLVCGLWLFLFVSCVRCVLLVAICSYFVVYVCCSLVNFVGGWLLFLVCCLRLIIWSLLFVVRCLLSVFRCSLLVVVCSLFACLFVLCSLCSFG